MKPCATRKQSLALFALRSLEASDADELQRHLASCPGCAAYLAEMNSLCRNMEQTAAHPGSIEPSPRFHAKLAQTLAREQTSRESSSFSEVVREWLAPARLAFGLALGLAIAGSVYSLRTPTSPGPGAALNPPPAPPVSSAAPPNDIAQTSTLLAYHRAFLHSDGALNELMTENELRAPTGTGTTLLQLSHHNTRANLQ